MLKKNKPYFQDAMTEILGEVGDGLIRKQLDYGPNAIARFGIEGIVIRMSDKMERLINLTQLQRDAEVDESIEDTLADIVGYAIHGLLMQRHDYPLPLKQKTEK